MRTRIGVESSEETSWPQEMFEVAERTAAADLNNLYRVSCFFADPDRYLAFCAMYAVMRFVDDRVDGLLARGDATGKELESERWYISACQQATMAAVQGKRPDRRHPGVSDHPEFAELLTSLAAVSGAFPIPMKLWRSFFRAMHRDLEQRRFSTYADFLAYTDGATVAPTTIYLFLIASERTETNGIYQTPEDFDLHGAGRDLGLFAYLAHVARDLAQDIQTGDGGLLYIAADDLADHGLTEALLRSEAFAGHAGTEVRSLVKSLVERAREALSIGRAKLTALEYRLSPDRAFILELVVRIYDAVLEKIEACSFDVMTGCHLLTDSDKQQIVEEVARSRGFDLAGAAAEH